MSIQLQALVPEAIPVALLQNSDIFGTKRVFEKGAKYLIQAPSGKGKSTLLHIIYGLRRDFGGQVLVNNQSVFDIAPDDFATLRASYLSIVFQDLRLFGQLTVRQNLDIKAALHPNLASDFIPMALKALQMQDFADQRADTLSYGQRQRVAIIRALCQPFSFLLLDEPFAHLDDENTQRAIELIQTACQQQSAGMLLVSLGNDYGQAFDQVLNL